MFRLKQNLAREKHEVCPQHITIKIVFIKGVYLNILNKMSFL